MKSLGAPVLGDEVRPCCCGADSTAQLWRHSASLPGGALPADHRGRATPPARYRSATRRRRRRRSATAVISTPRRCASGCRARRCRWCAGRRMETSSWRQASSSCLTPGCRKTWRQRRAPGCPTAACCGRSCRRSGPAAAAAGVGHVTTAPAEPKLSSAGWKHAGSMHAGRQRESRDSRQGVEGRKIHVAMRGKSLRRLAERLESELHQMQERQMGQGF